MTLCVRDYWQRYDLIEAQYAYGKSYAMHKTTQKAWRELSKNHRETLQKWIVDYVEVMEERCVSGPTSEPLSWIWEFCVWETKDTPLFTLLSSCKTVDACTNCSPHFYSLYDMNEILNAQKPTGMPDLTFVLLGHDPQISYSTHLQAFNLLETVLRTYDIVRECKNQHSRTLETICCPSFPQNGRYVTKLEWLRMLLRVQKVLTERKFCFTTKSKADLQTRAQSVVDCCVPTQKMGVCVHTPNESPTIEKSESLSHNVAPFCSEIVVEETKCVSTSSSPLGVETDIAQTPAPLVKGTVQKITLIKTAPRKRATTRRKVLPVVLPEIVLTRRCSRNDASCKNIVKRMTVLCAYTVSLVGMISQENQHLSLEEKLNYLRANLIELEDFPQRRTEIRPDERFYILTEQQPKPPRKPKIRILSEHELDRELEKPHNKDLHNKDLHNKDLHT